MPLTNFKIGKTTIDYYKDGTVSLSQVFDNEKTEWEDIIEIPFVDLLKIVNKLLETKTSETKRGRDTIP